MTEPTSGPTLAMVALRGDDAPDAAAVVRTLTGGWRHLGPVELPESGEDTAVFSVGGQSAFVSHMPGPIPWTDLEWPAQAAHWYWPEAESELRAHRTHVLVGVMGSDDPLRQRLLVTYLAAAVCAAGGAAGIYWGSGSIVTPPEMFIDSARDASSDNLPLDLWINLSWARRPDDGRLEAITRGLTDFGHIELGTRAAKPGDIIEMLFDVAHYLVTTGAQLGDGQTLGGSENERIPIRHAAAPWDPHETVAWIGD